MVVPMEKALRVASPSSRVVVGGDGSAGMEGV